MLLLQAVAPQGTVEHVISWVGEFILGGIAIFAIFIAYWAIQQWKLSRDAHTEDLKTAGDQHVEMHKAYQASNSQVVAAIDRLSKTQEAHTLALQSATTELAAVKATSDNSRGAIDTLSRRVDEVIREAVIRRRSFDRMPAVKGDSDR
jgi:hypothetical protein